MTDTQANIRRIAEIVRALDTSIANISVVKVFRLQFADAKELAEVVNEIFEFEAVSSSRNDRRSRFERYFSRMRGDSDDRSSSSSSEDSKAMQASSRVVAVADENTNALVVSAPGDLMPTIEELVIEVDTLADDITAVRVFRLHYAGAEEMVDIITSLFQESTQTEQPRRRFRFFGPPRPSPSSGEQDSSQRQVQEERVVAVADTRTNSVVVTAASQTMAQIERMVRELDSDPAKDRKVFIYSLENADAETVAEILTNMFEERASGTGYSRTGTSRTSSTRQPVFGQETQRSTSGTSESRFGSR